MNCIDGCIHVDISTDMKYDAQSAAEKIARQKGFNNPRQFLLRKDPQYSGFIVQLAHTIYIEKVLSMHLDELPPLFNPKRHDDDYDFKLRNSRYDVKKTFDLGIGTHYAKCMPCHIVDTNRKDTDWYMFGTVDPQHEVVHLLGGILYEEFWDNAVAWQGQKPGHKIPSCWLTPFLPQVLRAHQQRPKCWYHKSLEKYR